MNTKKILLHTVQETKLYHCRGANFWKGNRLVDLRVICYWQYWTFIALVETWRRVYIKQGTLTALVWCGMSPKTPIRCGMPTD